jgi:ElaB/YqjD/DUF883 family membrane-anchored ribosome-binding protein
MNNRLDNARERFAEAAQRARQRLGQVFPAAGGEGDASGPAFKERFGEAWERLRGGCEHLASDWGERTAGLTSWVRAHPGRSVVAAAVVGFVLGLLTRRSSR